MSDLSVHQPNSYDIPVASQEAEPPSPTTSSKAEPSAAGAQAADDSAHLAQLAEQFSAAGSGTGEPSGSQTPPRPLLGNPAANQPAQARPKAPPKQSSGVPGGGQGGSRAPGRPGRPKLPGLSLNLAPAASLGRVVVTGGNLSSTPASPTQTVAAGGGEPATSKLGGKDKQEILAEMAGMDKPTFSPATKFPTYAEFQSGRLEKSENKNDHYGFHPDPLQGFTVANRTSAAKPNDQSEPDSKSEPDNKFEGQKIHISVDPAKAKEAYEALAPLLFSADSPIDRFKMTDMGEARAAGTDEANRVSQGAQFTIYLKPDPKQNEFNASHLNKIHSFVGKVTENLQQSGVGPGTRPSSDAELPGDYASFRNEKLAESNDKESAEKSKQDPVYQILNPQNPLNP